MGTIFKFTLVDVIQNLRICLENCLTVSNDLDQIVAFLRPFKPDTDCPRCVCSCILRCSGCLPVLKFFIINNKELKQACNVFEPRTATGSEHFARQDSGVSQIFKLMVSTCEKRLNNINVVGEDKLNRKTARFRLPSVAKNVACLSSLIAVIQRPAEVFRGSVCPSSIFSSDIISFKSSWREYCGSDSRSFLISPIIQP